MGEHKSEKLYVSVPSVVNRYALTQPQRRRGTETKTTAVPDPHNSAKSLSFLLPLILEKKVVHLVSLGLQVPAVDVIGLNL